METPPILPPPPLWQWADLVAAFVAFGLAIVALPTAFQMWWGRPKITVRYVKAHRDYGVVLQAYINNERLKSHVLRWLGVRRDAATVAADYEVRESGTRRLVVSSRVPLNTENGSPSLRTTLTVGLPAIFAIGVQESGGGFVKLMQDGEYENCDLMPGEYEVHTRVVVDDYVISHDGVLRVGDETSKTYWKSGDDI